MSRIGVVTGATQGLGFALAEGLAQQLAPGDIVYLTGRDAERVDAAVERVTRPRAELRGHVLDVGDGAAVDAFADEIRARHGGGVDIVFSNAAARLTPGTPSTELVGPFVSTNNLGATRMLRAFAPILRPGGRLLVVASDFGYLRRLPTHLQGSFDTDAMTLDDVDTIMLAWRDAVVEGRAAEEGWPDWINIPSCPGLIDTPASRPWFNDMSGAQTPAEAAATPLRLALDPAADLRLYGELVQFGKIIPWC